MHRSAISGSRIQKALDWTVFGVGAVALGTAIFATAFGPADGRLADATRPAAESVDA